MTKPWNTGVNVLDNDAGDKISKLGQEAMDLLTFTLICNHHGEFAWHVPEGKIELEEARHRAGEACWHNLEAR